MSRSVVFQPPFRKTTVSTILHLFSTVYKAIFQVLKSTFADLLECGEKEIGRKDRRIPEIQVPFGNTVFPIYRIRWFFSRIQRFFISFR